MHSWGSVHPQDQSFLELGKVRDRFKFLENEKCIWEWVIETIPSVWM